MRDINRLLQRFEAKMDQRRSLLLSPEELDLLVEAGAYKVLAEAAISIREQASRDRIAQRRGPEEDEK